MADSIFVYLLPLPVNAHNLSTNQLLVAMAIICGCNIADVPRNDSATNGINLTLSPF